VKAGDGHLDKTVSRRGSKLETGGVMMKPAYPFRLDQEEGRVSFLPLKSPFLLVSVVSW
jgi:hypothetical protein